VLVSAFKASFCSVYPAYATLMPLGIGKLFQNTLLWGKITIRQPTLL
jgi:hypothetical protein